MSVLLPRQNGLLEAFNVLLFSVRVVQTASLSYDDCLDVSDVVDDWTELFRYSKAIVSNC